MILNLVTVLDNKIAFKMDCFWEILNFTLDKFPKSICQGVIWPEINILTGPCIYIPELSKWFIFGVGAVLFISIFFNIFYAIDERLHKYNNLYKELKIQYERRIKELKKQLDELLRKKRELEGEINNLKKNSAPRAEVERLLRENFELEASIYRLNKLFMYLEAELLKIKEEEKKLASNGDYSKTRWAKKWNI